MSASINSAPTNTLANAPIFQSASGSDDSQSLARISIFGLGYVGCVSAACFASRGHRVIGIDVDVDKVNALAQGEAPIVEERIAQITAEGVGRGLLTATQDAAGAIHSTDITMVCVGTPSSSTGSMSTVYLERVTEEIGEALSRKDGWHVVVYRSTMAPGTCEALLIPLLQRSSGKVAGQDFGVCVNPEFLREGTSVADFFNPPKTVIGQTDEASGAAVVALYDGLPGSTFQVPIAIGEMTKYVDNTFHALKVSYANEIGAMCSKLKLDSHAVMDIFLSDSKLNLGPAYLRPGFAFGGSCLPKDVRALVHSARRHDVEMPLISNILNSNEAHLRRAMDLILSSPHRRIGLFGLSFKDGTDDLRESPMVELAERLIGKGYELLICDDNVSLSRLIGKNRRYIEDRLPHIAELLTGTDEVLEHADILVIGSRDPSVLKAVQNVDGSKEIIDLVRLPDAASRRSSANYSAIAW